MSPTSSRRAVLGSGLPGSAAGQWRAALWAKMEKQVFLFAVKLNMHLIIYFFKKKYTG